MFTVFVAMLQIGADVFAAYANNTRLQHEAQKYLGGKQVIVKPDWTSSVQYFSTQEWSTYGALQSMCQNT